MEHENFSERLSVPSPDAFPAQGDSSEIDVERSRIASQIHILETLALVRAFAAYRTEEDPTPEDILEEFFQSQGNEERGIQAYQRVYALLSSHEQRMTIAMRLANRALGDGWRYENYMGDMISQMKDRMEAYYVRPFELLQQKMEGCAALPDSVFRRQMKEDLVGELRSLTKELPVHAETWDADENVRWTFSDDEPNKDLLAPQGMSIRFLAGDREEFARIGFPVKRILEAYTSLRSQENISDLLMPIDHERVKELTSTHGAKTANLMEMERLMPALQEVLRDIDIPVAVPRFTSIPVAVYDAYVAGEDIDQQLRGFYEWINGTSVFVRSSAVYGEDNAVVTGAGIYDSVCISADASFDTFKAAVLQVYDSVNADTAVRYRSENGIPEEKMGITLMDTVYEYSHPDSFVLRSGKGFVNSSRAYAPQLIDVVMENGERPIFVKEKLRERLLYCDRDMHDAQFFEYDRSFDTVRTILLQAEAGCIAILIEKIYGKPVQIEFVADGMTFQVVQTRVLPPIHAAPADISFPDAKAIITRDATGVMNEELDILSHDPLNKHRKGLVIFQKSFFGSDTRPETYFPKEGAIMVLAPSKENGGHIETLCAEKGIVCIFKSQRGFDENAQLDPEVGYGHSRSQQLQSRHLPNIHSLNGLTRVRVVANGIEARIYAPDEGGEKA